MTRAAALLSIFAALGFLAGTPARACDTQRENPVFVSAKAEVEAMKPAERAKISSEWNELEAEQRSLWKLAGEIDAACLQGGIPPEYLSYAERVLEWEQRLSKFLHHLHSPIAAPSGRPEPTLLPGLGEEPVAPRGPEPQEIEFPGHAAKAGGATAPSSRPVPPPPPLPNPAKPPARPTPEPQPTEEPLTPPALL